MMNKEVVKHYNKLYKYCTTARVHGAIYKKKLKELKNITTVFLRQERIERLKDEKESTNNKDNCNNN